MSDRKIYEILPSISSLILLLILKKFSDMILMFTIIKSIYIIYCENKYGRMPPLFSIIVLAKKYNG